jgi:DNA-binding NarL/FixJ family response regulator
MRAVPSAVESPSRTARKTIAPTAITVTMRVSLATRRQPRGLTTNEISSQLHLSAYTVQDHLKTIFDKSGTGSRGELVSRLFFDHHVARLTSSYDHA